ncbi:nocturnin isoform X2 [Diprion similis]|uniref:nocturnin isoform X2 n=1 Tax=Diprion similis TaxID=362088 RepID=UPI001EF7F14D|nr:nocturnin isoform X2 [Diprion similis]
MTSQMMFLTLRNDETLAIMTAPSTAKEDSLKPYHLQHFIIQRMGSFTSSPKILNEDAQDSDVNLPARMSRSEMLDRCRCEGVQPLLRRHFKGLIKDVDVNTADDFKMLQINAVPKTCVQPLKSPNKIRVFQWNVLSQSLGTTNDSFVCCPEDALEWGNRRYQIVQEILEYAPDVICLQEVDHFNFLKTCLETQGYTGTFFPKPDSPCLYLDGNNGPDGCALFYRRDKFDFVKSDTRVLEVWRVQSNQVAVVAVLRVRETGREFLVAGTHLKARKGALLSTLRNEQGKDLLNFVSSSAEGRPVLLCGDFNAEPTEPIYRTVLGYPELNLASAYADFSTDKDIPSMDREPPYTTWKVRDEGEVCHTIDYVFYNKNAFAVNAVLQFPTAEDIGEGRVPSYQYPSDHFSLCCDFRFQDQEITDQTHIEELKGISSL